MPITSKYNAPIRIVVGLASASELEANKTKATNFIANQVSQGNIEASSYAAYQYHEDEVNGKDGASFWLQINLNLVITNWSIFPTIRNAIVNALDTFDLVIDYDADPREKLLKWTATV